MTAPLREAAPAPTGTDSQKSTNKALTTQAKHNLTQADG
jgi:hypothetical protein